jgi:hypothetical protein
LLEARCSSARRLSAPPRCTAAGRLTPRARLAALRVEKHPAGLVPVTRGSAGAAILDRHRHELGSNVGSSSYMGRVSLRLRRLRRCEHHGRVPGRLWPPATRDSIVRVSPVRENPRLGLSLSEAAFPTVPLPVEAAALAVRYGLRAPQVVFRSLRSSLDPRPARREFDGRIAQFSTRGLIRLGSFSTNVRAGRARTFVRSVGSEQGQGRHQRGQWSNAWCRPEI